MKRKSGPIFGPAILGLLLFAILFLFGCIETPSMICGNSVCETGENTNICPSDCHAADRCGDNRCQNSERQTNSCPQDCNPNQCGNRLCESGENGSNCPSDCPIATPVCGNHLCEANETPQNCPSDCATGGQVCGNQACENKETTANCPSDCENPTANCGNRVCETGETIHTCLLDCFACNENNSCEADIGENTQSCPHDCPADRANCGNNLCETGETTTSCPVDCTLAPSCGDGQCNANETNSNCPSDCPTNTCGNSQCDAAENSQTCPTDCPMAPTCGDGTCNATETTQTCPADCPATAPSCGDNQCNETETHNSCPTDCPLTPSAKPVIYFDFHPGIADNNPAFLSDHSLIDAVIVGVVWSDVEPAENQFDFTAIDNQIAIWNAAGKKVILRFAAYGQAQDNAFTPAWVKAKVPLIEFLNNKTELTHVPKVWEPSFQTIYGSFVTALAQKYGSDSRVYAIQIGIGHIGFLTAQPSKEGETAFIESGWTLPIWETYAKSTIDLYKQKFTTTKLQMVITPQYTRNNKVIDNLDMTKRIANHAANQNYDILFKGADPDLAVFNSTGFPQVLTDIASHNYANTSVGFGDDWPLFGQTGSKVRTEADFQSALNNVYNLWNSTGKKNHLYLTLLDNELTASQTGNAGFNQSIYNSLTAFIANVEQGNPN